MKRSIALRIGAYIGILVLVICIGLGYFSIKRGGAAVSHRVEEALLNQAAEAAKYIQLTVDRQMSILEAIAARQEIKSMGWMHQQPILTSEIERLKSFETLAVFDTEFSGRAFNGSYLDGTSLAYLRGAIQGKRSISQTLISQLTGEAIIVFAVPIKDNYNRVVGVLTGSFPGADFSNIVDQLGFGKTGDAFILQSDGTVLAHPNRDYVSQQRNVFTDSELNPVGAAIQKLGVGNSGLISYTMNGETKMGAVTVIPDLGWIVGVTASEAEMLEDVNDLRTTLLLISLVFAVLGAILGVLGAKQIARPLERIKGVIEAVAQGDLTIQAAADSKDEIGAVAVALNSTVESVRTALSRTAQAGEEVTQTSQELAAMAEEVSASIEEIASTTNQFSSAIELMNQGAQSMNRKVESIFEQAADGDRAIQEITSQMETLRSTSKRMSEDIAGLGTLSEQIGNIANVIDAIANQTNLLALNAAIEAARAGEHGRGFAVVADEVRKLAEQSSTATTEIDSLIKKVQSGISRAVKDMQDSYGMTSNALVSVEQSSSVLRAILSEVEEIARQVESISGELEQLNTGGKEIASSTEEQAGTIEQVASAAQHLTSLADTLKELLSYFKLQ